MTKISNSIKVAWLLASTRIRRSGILSNLLIILVMTLTFLNLLVVRGILIGLPAGAVSANEDKYYADLFISTKTGEKRLDRYKEIERALDSIDGIASYVPRYITSSTITADFDKRIKNNEKPNQISPRILGTTIIQENALFNWEESLQSGSLIERDSKDQIMLGVDLIADAGAGDARGTSTLENVQIGSEVELTINSITKVVTVVGLLNTKINEIDSRAVISKALYRDFVDTTSYKPSEYAVKLKQGFTPKQIQETLFDRGLQAYADIETPEEYQPSFVTDIIDTFAILGDVIGSISLTVAAITIFIIIFVNALTQKKQIGILKGIGIYPEAIEISYIIQALFYVLFGAFISFPLLYGVLVPYFEANPINFPFSDGILVAEYSESLVRTAIMFVITGIAGYIPARKIVKQNTLDSILGR